MDLFETLEVDFSHVDEKGFLVQLVHEGFHQINVLKSKAGTQRGDHYHKFSREAFYIASGSVELTLLKQDHKQKRVFREGDFFLIPTGVRHIMDFPQECIMVAMYDKPIELKDGQKDIWVED